MEEHAKQRSGPWGLLQSCTPKQADIFLHKKRTLNKHFCISRSPIGHLAYIKTVRAISTVAVNNVVLQKGNKYMLLEDDEVFIESRHARAFRFKMLLFGPDNKGARMLPGHLSGRFAVGDLLEASENKRSFIVFERVTRQAFFFKELQLSDEQAKTVRPPTINNIYLLRTKYEIYTNKLLLFTKYHRESNLHSCIADGMSMSDLKFLFFQMVEGITCIHTILNTHHGRLKPENIFVLDRQNLPRVQISDFGLPKIQEEPAPTKETPFVAPEIVDGLADSNKKSDIWCLGEILHYMIHRTIYFVGEERYLKIVGFNILNYSGMNGSVDKASSEDLLSGMIKVNVEERLNIGDVRSHEWLTSVRDISVLV